MANLSLRVPDELLSRFDACAGGQGGRASRATCAHVHTARGVRGQSRLLGRRAMTNFHTVQGFKDVWRPPVRPRSVRPRTVLRPSQASSGGVRARLERIAARAPEVMVKVTGRTRDGAHLRAHLEYISRNGQLELEGADGALIVDRHELADLADEWAGASAVGRSRRKDSPLSHSVDLRTCPQRTPSPRSAATVPDRPSSG